MKDNLKNNLIGYRRAVVPLLTLLLLTGCATYPGWIPSSGPSRQQVQEKPDARGITGIQLVDVNDAVTRQLLASRKQSLFSEAFATTRQPGYVVGAGDMIVISIWEAPPAMLFGNMMASVLSGTSSGTGNMVPPTTQATTFPEQMVSSDGTINIPFAGHVPVAGHNPQWIEEEIVRRLKGLANQPQALVQVTHNNTANVTIVGDVNTSLRMPLTAKGELLLDALAAAGGAKNPVNKTTLQITRGDRVQSLPLETIIRDPRQNIVLQPGDLITALYQPLSFIVLGATGTNGEVNFEAQGISLSQALARSGWLDHSRADARAVFIFRFEDKAALDWQSPPMTTPEGKVPVIYQVDLRDPAAFFVAQSFPVQNRDVLYVSNAPGTELQKFLSIIMTSAAPLVDLAIIKNATR
jgi:polysaccharide biosynthesis/export protein